MVNRPKSIGTAAETAVVRAARTRGFPNADRLTLTGALDRGDIGLAPGVIVEVKGGAAAKDASDGLIWAWLDETERERRHAFADVAILVVQRRAVGTPNAHRWWAWWRLGDLEQLRSIDPRCRVCGCTDAQACFGGCAWLDSESGPPCCTSCDPRDPNHRVPVRMTLGDAFTLLRAAGYGEPIATPRGPHPWTPAAGSDPSNADPKEQEPWLTRTRTPPTTARPWATDCRASLRRFPC